MNVKRKVWVVMSSFNGNEDIEGLFWTKKSASKLLWQLVRQKDIKSEMSLNQYCRSRELVDNMVSFISDDVLYQFWLTQEIIQD